MKLYMKQKIFSLLDSYKIFNEFDEVEYYVMNYHGLILFKYMIRMVFVLGK